MRPLTFPENPADVGHLDSVVDIEGWLDFSKQREKCIQEWRYGPQIVVRWHLITDDDGLTLGSAFSTTTLIGRVRLGAYIYLKPTKTRITTVLVTNQFEHVCREMRY